MPNQNPDPTGTDPDETGQPPAEETDEQPAGDPPAGDPPADPEPTPSREDDLPEWARKELTSVRAEAANYRVRLRGVEEQLAAAKTSEEVEEIVSELRTENARLERELLVTRVATKHKLPDELREVLKGETEDELESHAKALAKFVPADDDEPGDLHGGLDPHGTDTEPSDPRALARRYGRGAKR